MSAPRVGNAPVSWAVYEADRPNPPFTRVLDEIAQAGYEGTELGPYGYLPMQPEDLARELRSRGLALGSSFLPLPLEDSTRRQRSVASALKVARLLSSQGVRELIIADDEDLARAQRAGRIATDGSAGWSAAQWNEAIATVHAVAHALRYYLGMNVVLHHHAGTFIEAPHEIDRFLAGTDPEMVGLLLDTGHAVYGGGDPVELLERHRQRILYVHLKDVRREMLECVRRTDISMRDAWARGVFCPLGEGIVDFPRFVASLRDGGYQGWLIVEQDVVPDAEGRLVPEPFESAKRSRAYLRSLGL
jgi:inosose dehydratase